MRKTDLTRCSLILLALTVSLQPLAASAAPVTGDTGPGGVGNTLGTSGLVLWLKNNTGLFQDIAQTTPATNPNDPVARWRDSSGWNHHADQATGTLQPSFQTGGPNGANIIRFAGDDLTTPNFGLVQSGASPAHVFSTLKYASSGGNASIMDGSSTNSIRVYVTSDSVFRLDGGGDFGGAVTNPLQYHNYTFGFAGTSSYIRSDSTSVATGSLGTGASPGVVSLGRSPATNEFANIDVPEFILFSQAISSVQRTVVENYLSSKFNVGPVVAGVNNSLPAGADHYAGDLSTAGNYDFDVFGIGNDGTSSVISAGNAGLGIETAGLASGDWVLAGHATGPNGVTTNDMPGGQRWERSWFIDATSVTTANLAFDWNDAGVTSAFNPQFSALYYRPLNSGFFSLVASGTVDTLNQRVDFSGITLPAADGYFTLGTIPVPEPSTLTLLGLGVIGLAIKRRRRRIA